jgi:hypothetical protein
MVMRSAHAATNTFKVSNKSVEDGPFTLCVRGGWFTLM